MARDQNPAGVESAITSGTPRCRVGNGPPRDRIAPPGAAAVRREVGLDIRTRDEWPEQGSVQEVVHHHRVAREERQMAAAWRARGAAQQRGFA